MNRGLRVAMTAAGFWAVLAVGHAIVTAEAIAEGAPLAPAMVGLRGLIYLVPLAVVGLWVLLRAGAAGEPGGAVVVRSLRMGLAIALFGVLLSWTLVIYAAYLATLVAP